MQSIFEDPYAVKHLVCLLVSRLGGTYEITQEDLDEVAYNCLFEESDAISLTLTVKGKVTQ